MRFVVLISLLSSCVGYQGPIRSHFFRPVVMKELPRPWRFSEDFPESMRPEVRKGFEFWNDVVGAPVFVETSDRKKSELVVLFTEMKNPDRDVVWAAAQVRIKGRLIRDTKILFYGPSRFVSDDTLVTISAHEIGHALGMLDHISDELCVMYEYIPRDIGLKPPCVQEVNAVREQYRKRASHGHR